MQAPGRHSGMPSWGRRRSRPRWSGSPRRLPVVCGEPGIGTSTARGSRGPGWPGRGALRPGARPGEAEAQLSFAGLARLVDGAGAEVLAGLPGPQRRALEVADLEGSASGPGQGRLLPAFSWSILDPEPVEGQFGGRYVQAGVVVLGAQDDRAG